MLDPAGNEWAARSSQSLEVGGWGTCESNWLGDPKQQPGTWAVSFDDTAGHGRQLLHWYTFYQR